jgi:hypothetical protein
MFGAIISEATEAREGEIIDRCIPVQFRNSTKY